ncbi:MAG: hypothetical protein QOF60_2474 [Actinomycetota bacterium]|nr:hypothetical protein [Actinomycetota bacterium]
MRERRKKAGLSQEELAELAGLDRSYIGQVETGRRNANLDTLSRLAIALNVDLGTLTRGLQEYPGRS